VKIRVRDPYVSKQVEEVKEKWLIIDQFDRKPPSPAVELKKAAGAVPAVARPSAEGSLPLPLASISVLRYEKQSLEQRMAQLKDRLNPTELKTLQSKGRALEKQAEELSEQLRKGGATANRAYVNNMTRLLASYVDESKVLAKQGNKDKLQTVLLKKKLVEKEIETIRSRYPVTS
jgi:coiled-coil and C2 domain-containing protein 1